MLLGALSKNVSYFTHPIYLDNYYSDDLFIGGVTSLVY